MGGCCSKPPPPGVPILVQPIKNTHGAATVIETSTGPVPIHVPDTGRMFTAHLPEGSEPLPLNNSFGQTMCVHVPRGIGCRQAFVYHAPFASYALTVPEPYPPNGTFQWNAPTPEGSSGDSPPPFSLAIPRGVFAGDYFKYNLPDGRVATVRCPSPYPRGNQFDYHPPPLSLPMAPPTSMQSSISSMSVVQAVPMGAPSVSHLKAASAATFPVATDVVVVAQTQPVMAQRIPQPMPIAVPVVGAEADPGWCTQSTASTVWS